MFRKIDWSWNSFFFGGREGWSWDAHEVSEASEVQWVRLGASIEALRLTRWEIRGNPIMVEFPLQDI
jgi:hypothetical protein